MKSVCYFGLGLFACLFLWRTALTLRFWKKRPKALPDPSVEGYFSIIQPILSGDEALTANLETNLLNFSQAHFIWIVDKDDLAAQAITADILTRHPQARHRVCMLVIESIPPDVNPKVFKLNFALPHAKTYSVILDDDTILHPTALLQAYPRLCNSEVLITGIPYYATRAGFFSRLVAAFVNANSLFTYFPLALLEPPKTINGMFYLTQTQLLKTLNAFTAIQGKLCDDYELAKLYSQNQLPIIQSPIPCRVTTGIHGFRHYSHLMKRWMVFANVYLSKNLTLNTFAMVMLPSFLPAFLLILSLFSGPTCLIIFLGAHFAKAVLTLLIRSYILNTREAFPNLLFEMLSDYLQPIHYFHALFRADRIQWRNATVILRDTKVNFKK